MRAVRVFPAFVSETNLLLTFRICSAQEGSVIFSRPKLCKEALESTFGRSQLQLTAGGEGWLGEEEEAGEEGLKHQFGIPCAFSPLLILLTSSSVELFIQQQCFCVPNKCQVLL